MILMRVLFVASAYSYLLEVVRRCPMVFNLIKFKHLSNLINGVPLSLMILQGTLNLTIIFFLMKFATAPYVAL